MGVISNQKLAILAVISTLHASKWFSVSSKSGEYISGPMKQTFYSEGVGGSVQPLLPNVLPLQAVPALTTTGGSKSPVKSLSQAEMDDRRRKKLCFWCASKYTPGHKR
ncbi:hypothetical protein J1N35_043046 [Gossypium stocksii]|uniref:Uncharacterized protein n=1 Tax=Gossypium stocksii TaxID=47602 RepID=A0A9D3U6P9_9ROSI|nr:hypothetical protein J1N35_043046 [Gossypium stocksii]